MKRHFICFLLSAIFLIFSTNIYAIPTIYLELPTTDIYAGNPFDVNVIVSGVGVGEGEGEVETYVDFISGEELVDEVRGFAFHVLDNNPNSNNPNYSYVGAVVWPNETLATFPEEGFYDDIALYEDSGIENLVAGSYFSFIPGFGLTRDNILLATLTFQALQEGDGLTIGIVSNNIFEGLFTGKYNGFDELQIDLTSNSDTFSINANNNTNPVPEPATMLLLGTGLIGIAGVGRKFVRLKQ